MTVSVTVVLKLKIETTSDDVSYPSKEADSVCIEPAWQERMSRRQHRVLIAPHDVLDADRIEEFLFEHRQEQCGSFLYETRLVSHKV